MGDKNSFNETFQIKKHTFIKEKYFVYQNKEYLINFDLLKISCYYFYQNQQKFEQEEIINLNDEIKDQVILNDESIRTFISCFQNEPFSISKESIISLQYLSHIFKFPELISITDKFVESHWPQLIFYIIQFKLENQTNTQNTFFDTTKEEQFISTHLRECIKDDNMVLLPVQLIYRCMKSSPIKGQYEGQFLRELIEFLFKCLDHHGKRASLLFNIVDFGDVNLEVFDRLLQNYSEVFDFNMINSTMAKTTKELCSDLAKQKREFSMDAHH